MTKPLIEDAFRRRLAKRRDMRVEAASSSNETAKTPRWLDTIGQISQISLAVVAIFGYFYTVRPIYQKERLAEQVAEYDGIIKKQTPKIAEIEQRLTALQSERRQLSVELQSQRARLTGELADIEHQLALARAEKTKIESQIQFMIFRYRLPDGSPAVTPEQVKTAQSLELKQSFDSTLVMSCTWGSRDGVFPSYSSAKADVKDKSWPFTEQEMSAWKEYGPKYPLKRAIECIDSVALRYSQSYGKNIFSAEIQALHDDAVQYANRVGAGQWTPPVQPEDILKDLAASRSAVESERAAELKKVEEQYGDWKSTLFPSRREIFKNNYEVGKRNAVMQANSKQLSLEYRMQSKADDLRKSIQDEVKRLIVKGSSK
jgi:hypothetical protein